MVYGDDHHVVVLGQVEAVVADLLHAGARGIAAPVNPEQHRPLGAGLAAFGPQVQVLAVLGGGPEPVGDKHLAGGHGLAEHRAVHAVAAGVLYALPGGDGLGHLEALCLGVADAVEVVHTVKAEAPQLALGGGDDGDVFAHDKFFHGIFPPGTQVLFLSIVQYSAGFLKGYFGKIVKSVWRDITGQKTQSFCQTFTRRIPACPAVPARRKMDVASGGKVGYNRAEK